MAKKLYSRVQECIFISFLGKKLHKGCTERTFTESPSPRSRTATGF